MDIEDNANCAFDNLIIEFTSTDQSQTICGSNLDDIRFPRLFSGVGSAQVRFTSDTSAAGNGFKLQYRIIRADPCQPNPCQNNSTCSINDERDEKFECFCDEFWSGETCSDDIDECAGRFKEISYLWGETCKIMRF